MSSVEGKNLIGQRRGRIRRKRLGWFGREGGTGYPSDRGGRAGWKRPSWQEEEGCYWGRRREIKGPTAGRREREMTPKHGAVEKGQGGC